MIVRWRDEPDAFMQPREQAEMTSKADMTKIEQRISHDLDLCEVGLALTRGALRRRYVRQRKACFAAIAEMNRADGFDTLSTDELLAALTEA